MYVPKATSRTSTTTIKKYDNMDIVATYADLPAGGDLVSEKIYYIKDTQKQYIYDKTNSVYVLILDVSQSISDLETVQNEQSFTIAIMGTTITNNTSDITTLNTFNTDQIIKNTSYTSDITLLKTFKDTQTTKNTAVDTEITNLNNYINLNTAAINTSNNNVSNNTTNITALQLYDTTLKNRIDALSQKFSVGSGNITIDSVGNGAYYNTIQDITTSSTPTFYNVISTNSPVNNTHLTNKLYVDNLNTTNTTNITALQTATGTNTTNITALQTATGTNTTNITALQSVTINGAGNIAVTTTGNNKYINTIDTPSFTNINISDTKLKLGFESGIGQSDKTVAFGYQAAYSLQKINAIAIGERAGNSSQGTASIAIGTYAGVISQANYSVALGNYAGQISQQTQAIAIGSYSGYSNQGENAIAMGYNSGYNVQGNNAIAIGYSSGKYTQGANAIAMGYNTGYTSQGANSIAIGISCGYTSQGGAAIAIGTDAGKQLQGSSSVAIGKYTGQESQSADCVAIGSFAGNTGQGSSSVAIGKFTGQQTQSTDCVAIGSYAGNIGQNTGSVAIGLYAGRNNLKASSVAIGRSADVDGTNSNTIILNATGSNLNSSSASSFYVKPIRNLTTADASLNSLIYNSTSGEITYGNKTFVINHPIDENKYLVHACLEGPENGVYYRGKGEIINNKYVIIELPEYTEEIASDFTIQLTQIIENEAIPLTLLAASNVINNKFRVYGNNCLFSWLIHGKRSNIEVEPLKKDYIKCGDGPYTYLVSKNENVWI